MWHAGEVCLLFCRPIRSEEYVGNGGGIFQGYTGYFGEDDNALSGEENHTPKPGAGLRGPQPSPCFIECGFR